MDLAGCSEITINTRFVIAICRIETIEKKNYFPQYHDLYEDLLFISVGGIAVFHFANLSICKSLRKPCIVCMYNIILHINNSS